MGNPAQLLGRDVEWRQVTALLAHARNGRGGALLIEGEPGIGKTALLATATSAAVAIRPVRVDGYESESTVPFAAIHRLTIPLRGFLPSVPERQREAILVAVGAGQGSPPSRNLVGLGLLSLLAAAGEASPVVCAIDDAHLLDPESLDTLAFVARRLDAESAALVFTSRNGCHSETRLAGVPTMHLRGLSTDSAVKLLMASLPEMIDPVAAAKVAAATGGNPLALIDLAAELSARRLTESSLAAEPIPVGRHLESFYIRRVRQLSEDLQLWLLVAATASTGDLNLIQGTSRRLGVSPSHADAAESAGHVELATTVRFRHPLLRSAAYHAAPGAERRRVHRAMSVVADEMGLVEVAAWHVAKATLGTNPDVANRLERVADLAGQRGGLASRAGLLAQASELSPPGRLKHARLVTAAEAALASGAAQLSKTLLDDVDEGSLDPLTRGRLIATRASQAILTADPALMHAGADMLAVATIFQGCNANLEHQALIKAFEFTLPAERLASGLSLAELGQRLRDGSELREGVESLILRALSAHILLPYPDAVPIMRDAVDSLVALEPADLLQYGPTSVALTTALWDAQARRTCLERIVAAARESGSIQVLDSTLWIMSLAELRGGTPRRARRYIEQVGELRTAVGDEADHVINVALLAWSGGPREQVQILCDGARAMGLGGVHASGVAALAVRDLAEGLYADAFTRLKPLIDDPFLQVTPLEYPDFVEAAVRSGHAKDARRLVEELHLIAQANGSAWARGVAQRSRALLEKDGAESHYESAIASLTAAGAEVELGRAHLLYGEWLRRCRRRREAQAHLRQALATFETSGALPFAKRAIRELEATGANSTSFRGPGGVDLTTQEITVARLVASGRTNAEIGVTMFISANTVDYHLRKVFQKLSISSRRQLAERLKECHDQPEEPIT
jgi:DNA-binding CsgD family transcriptional regulator